MFLSLLAALTAVVVLGRLLGRVFQTIGQPPVIGEVVAGILLGPSLLGAVAPGAYQFIFPASVLAPLGLLSQLGIVLYMFLVGVELNPDVLRGHVHSTVAIAIASIVVPFALGAWLAMSLYSRVSPVGVPLTHFALFLGVAMSITAFPVLARILADRKMSKTILGALALACAAVADVTAWCLLAFVVGVVQSQSGSALFVSATTIAFIAVLFIVVRPIAVRVVRRWEDREPDKGAVAFALIAMLVAALITEVIGVHAIFGAFLMGVVIPHDSRLAKTLELRLDNLVTILLLPAFFAFAGIRTEVGLLSSGQAWLTCAAIIAVATVGKFGGTLVAARATGLDWRHAAGLGVLMNTRGLMELIVLNVGLDLGVISSFLFTMMVLMALATTMATTPLLLLVFGKEQSEASPAQPALGNAQ